MNFDHRSSSLVSSSFLIMSYCIQKTNSQCTNFKLSLEFILSTALNAHLANLTEFVFINMLRVGTVTWS